MLTELEKKGIEDAKRIIKKGDRIRCIGCSGVKRVFTFDHWEDIWMVSKSGIYDYHPFDIERINGKEVNFKYDKK